VYEEVATAGQSVAWLFVAYNLTPEWTYPTQIGEGVEALNHLLNERRRSPSEIIIGGDSAGAAITLAILSHLSHPCPEFPNVTIDGKLKAAVLMAPWVSFRADWPSYEKNESKDVISITRLKAWSDAYKDERLSDNYI